ncbi:MAG TPA: ECF-type sigma factor [Gemmatimonadaceae bacterium]|nr:ECF-type sigma factor [Gemmatimonadaceae bacterium]
MPTPGAAVRSGIVEAQHQTIGELIGRADTGDVQAAEQMFAVLYDELHRLAEAQLRRHGPALTLGATTLLHEAYLQLAGREGARFPDRARFLGYAARAMRWLVIDYARRSRAQKRGGGAFEITLSEVDADVRPAAPELERLSEAIDALAALDPALAQLVDLHFFCGFTFAELAAFRGVSERTVQRDWRKARVVLHEALLE